jgi:hypothetical protein
MAYRGNAAPRRVAARVAFSSFVSIVLLLLATASARAGGVFAVEDAGVDDPDMCKIETFGQRSSKRDVVGVVSPTCSFDLIKPIEIGASLARFRVDKEWGTELFPKLKTQLFESDGTSAAVVVGAGFDLLAGRHSAASVIVPVTRQLHNDWKGSLNAGWLWIRDKDLHFFRWGAEIEYKPVETFTIIAELFGGIGSGASSPSLQAGLRFTPIPALDLDLIYGRNVYGEKANWIMLGMNVRLDGPWKRER